jgi:hypothetical protein
MFQTLLGALRAFRVEAGELREELLAGLGVGSVRDEAGNQWVGVGTVRVFATFGGEIEAFATGVRAAIDKSQGLRNALWLNGRLGRTAADYYMIHEYAQADLGGTKGVRDALGIWCERSGEAHSVSQQFVPAGRWASRDGNRIRVVESRGTAGLHRRPAQALDPVPRVAAQ